jgi:hypothetical protein
MTTLIKKFLALGMDLETATKLSNEQIKREELKFKQKFIKEENHFTKFDGVQIK